MVVTVQKMFENVSMARYHRTPECYSSVSLVFVCHFMRFANTILPLYGSVRNYRVQPSHSLYDSVSDLHALVQSLANQLPSLAHVT